MYQETVKEKIFRDMVSINMIGEDRSIDDFDLQELLDINILSVSDLPNLIRTLENKMKSTADNESEFHIDTKRRFHKLGVRSDLRDIPALVCELKEIVGEAYWKADLLKKSRLFSQS